MLTQPEKELLHSYANMNDRDRASLVSYARACARENPRPKPRLTLIVGRCGNSNRAFSGDLSSHPENLRPALTVGT